MKAILEFNLSDENHEDVWHFRLINQAQEMYFALVEIYQRLRLVEKYPDNLTIDDLINEIRSMINERNINLEI